MSGMWPGSGWVPSSKAARKCPSLHEILQALGKSTETNEHFAKVGKLMSFYIPREDKLCPMPPKLVARPAIAA